MDEEPINLAGEASWLLTWLTALHLDEKQPRSFERAKRFLDTVHEEKGG